MEEMAYSQIIWKVGEDQHRGKAWWRIPKRELLSMTQELCMTKTYVGLWEFKWHSELEFLIKTKPQELNPDKTQ